MSKILWLAVLSGAAVMAAAKMNPHGTNGKVHEVSGRVRQMWGGLTGNKQVQVEGAMEELAGKIEQRTSEKLTAFETKLEDLSSKLERSAAYLTSAAPVRVSDSAV